MLALIFIFLSPTMVFAEYRAFELRISNATTGKVRTVTSTLDQYQYPEYHHTQMGDNVEYVSSWMCRGRTSDFMAICPNPGALVAPTQNPVAPNPADPALQSPAN